MSVLVGVDAGASRTTALVGPEAGDPLARAGGPGGAVRPGEVGAAASVIAETVGRALEAAGVDDLPRAVLVGAAGAGSSAAREALGAALLPLLGAVPTLRVTTDAEIALAAAFGAGSGIVVSAGTGSIAFARDPEGNLHRAGGLGWRLGDEGSGYALGRAALRAVARAADGRGPPTALSERLRRRLGTPDLDALVAWSLTAPPAAVAELAIDACEAARAGDREAGALVEQTAHDLADLVLALAARWPAPAPVPVAASGGLLQPDSPVRGALGARLSAALPATRLRNDQIDPALGALALARALP